MGERRSGAGSARRAARNNSAVRSTREARDTASVAADTVPGVALDCDPLHGDIVAPAAEPAAAGVATPAAAAAPRAACGIGGPERGDGRRLIGGGAGVNLRRIVCAGTAPPFGSLLAKARSTLVVVVRPMFVAVVRRASRPVARSEPNATPCCVRPAVIDPAAAEPTDAWPTVAEPVGPLDSAGSPTTAVRRNTGNCGRTDAVVAARGASAIETCCDAADDDKSEVHAAFEADVGGTADPGGTGRAATGCEATAGTGGAPALVLLAGASRPEAAGTLRAPGTFDAPGTWRSPGRSGSRWMRGRGGTAVGAILAAPPPAGVIT